MTDTSGRKFDNFSSLEIDWSVSDESLSSKPAANSLSTEINSAYGRIVVTGTALALLPVSITSVVFN